MLTDVLIQVSKFLYGEKASIEGLIARPLLKNEVLMQDSWGSFRRIQAPVDSENSWFSHYVFRLQTYMNSVDSVKAIENAFASLNDVANAVDIMSHETFEKLSNKTKALGESLKSSTTYVDTDISELTSRCIKKIKTDALHNIWENLQGLNHCDFKDYKKKLLNVKAKIDNISSEIDPVTHRSLHAIYQQENIKYCKRVEEESLFSTLENDDRDDKEYRYPSPTYRCSTLDELEGKRTFPIDKYFK